VRFVEAAEAALMRERGLSGYFSVAPRVRYEVDFERPLSFGQEVVASVQLERLGTTSMTFAFEIWGEEFDGRPPGRAASGCYTTVHITGSHADGSARAAPWPPAWTRALTDGSSDRES
jgi:acyl-CoA thioester hydrolase